MINIALVEDEQSAADTFIEYAQKYCKENNFEANVQWFNNAITFIEKYKHDIDIVFMDIEMPLLDGMSAVKKLRDIDESVIVIFVTNLARYAVKGYEVNAFDFMVKPISYLSFSLKIKRALAKIEVSKDAQIWISSRHGKKLVKSGDLMYVEVMKHVIIYHTISGNFRGSGTLKQEREKLSQQLFVMCNSCYLVNLKYVTEIKDYSVIVGGNELQISSAKRKSFICALNNYLGAFCGKCGEN